ncbi:MAG: lysophospholipid acyltransferase family protein [Rhodospirillales bacterium]
MTIERSRLRAVVRLVLIVAVTILLLAPYILCFSIWPRAHYAARSAWSRTVCRLLGLRVRVSGTAHPGGTALFAANHVSYLDIPVLAGLHDGTFVAKSEVADWPLLGLICKWGRTVFINRSPAEARAQTALLRARLARGESLILFPEGTSTDGSGVAPFKSSLFNIAEDLPPGTPLVVQPVSVAYVRALDGTPLVGPLTELYCWYGGATLAPHLMRVCGLPGAVVDVRFHPPIAVASDVDRKSLARRCHAAVADGVAAAHGRALGPGRTAAVR